MKADANPFSEAKAYYADAKLDFSDEKRNATKLKEKGISTSADDQSTPKETRNSRFLLAKSAIPDDSIITRKRYPKRKAFFETKEAYISSSLIRTL